MTILGIITEYNPFHYGHKFHLKKAKAVSKADYTICVMNGNFMQRGCPALINKWARTKMALKNDVDLVIELPLIYGIRSAEYFAQGSIQILNSLGIVDFLVFGSEVGNINYLKKIAQIFIKEDKFFKKCLHKYIKKGLSFPKAREKALLDYLIKSAHNNNQKEIEVIKKIIQEPNNILGIEYLKALYKSNSPIIPLTIERKGQGYHDTNLKEKIASASAIRKQIYQNKLNDISSYLPQVSFQIMENEIKAGRGPVNKDNLDLIILKTLREMNIGELRKYEELSHGLEYRFLAAAQNSGTLSQLITKIKSKNLTQTRIQRNLLHIIFNLKANHLNYLTSHGPAYLRILGFNQKGEKLLSLINKKSNLPLITKVTNHLHSIYTKSNDPLIKSLSYDILATDIFSLLYPNPLLRKANLDFTNPIIKIT